EGKQNIEVSNKIEYRETSEYEQPDKIEPEYYIVQVGAFSSYKNASKQASSIKRKGFDVALLKVTGAGRTYYKVRAGKFRDENNAQKLAQKLRLKGFNAEIVEG
ncbi:MAG: SPOR domain-containing protein, partial [Candidatus Omnitrophica bacterium]|nr:SPOR domain-containing protein [Candidatus Omnitrophota bacterium]